MSNNFLDSNGVLYLWQKIKNIFATKEELNNTMTNLGAGDMLRSVYDTDANGVVDNAEKLGGHTPDYYSTKEHKHEISDVNGLKDALDDAASAEHTHKQSDVDGLSEIVSTMTAIAQGKCKAEVFDTVEELDAWLEVTENTAKLNTGDVFLIRAVNVPDYWWDGKTNSKQILETTKVEIPVITNSEIDTIVAS